ncbi:hypothetical protein BYT27DRAFT_7127116 [Phlegmacium glaucopus]|nr:hypothetical protein BYT27DRAFT_7127116 [Phlegmacium glaucopus]
MQYHHLKLEYHYLRFKVTPPTKDVLIIRKTIIDCLQQSFGSTVASTHMDILWVDDDNDGNECVIRTHIMDAKIISAAMTAGVAPSASIPRLSLVKDSPFLPSLLSSTDTHHVARR